MGKLFNFLEFMTITDSRFKKFIYTIFIPIFLLLEYICYLWYWKKIIISEMLTSDAIIDFLDKNEFCYEGNKIWKADLIEANEYFDRLSLADSKSVIRKEYIETLSKILAENLAFNVEEYISLLVNTEIKVIKDNGELFRDKIYTVTIQFCRLHFLNIAKRKFIYWFFFASIIVTTILLYFNHSIIFK